MSLRAAAAAAGLVLVLDRATKHLVVETLDLKRVLALDVIPGVFALRMAWNRGVNFGVLASDLQTARWGLVGLAAAISLALAVWAARRRQRRFGVGAGLLIGGALGNAWDRVVYGAVADFLNVTCCGLDNPWSFNVADAAIFLGALVVALAPDPAPARQDG